MLIPDLTTIFNLAVGQNSEKNLYHFFLIILFDCPRKGNVVMDSSLEDDFVLSFYYERIMCLMNTKNASLSVSYFESIICVVTGLSFMRKLTNSKISCLTTNIHWT